MAKRLSKWWYVAEITNNYKSIVSGAFDNRGDALRDFEIISMPGKEFLRVINMTEFDALQQPFIIFASREWERLHNEWLRTHPSGCVTK